MSLRDYLHERAEESRHNETLGFLILAIGIIALMAGLLLTAITVENPDWFLLIPYKFNTNPYSLLGLSSTVVGCALSIFGIAFSMHSALQRTMYIDRLKQAQENGETIVIDPELQLQPTLQKKKNRM